MFGTSGSGTDWSAPAAPGGVWFSATSTFGISRAMVFGTSPPAESTMPLVLASACALVATSAYAFLAASACASTMARASACAAFSAYASAHAFSAASYTSRASRSFLSYASRRAAADSGHRASVEPSTRSISEGGEARGAAKAVLFNKKAKIRKHPKKEGKHEVKKTSALTRT